MSAANEYSLDEERLFWKSSLFNEHDIKASIDSYFNDFFENSSQYQIYKAKLDSLFSEFYGHEKAIEGWSETETISSWIYDVLSALGWKGIVDENKFYFREELSATVQERKKSKTYRVDIAALSTANSKVYNSVKTDLANARRYVSIPIEAKFWGRIDLEDSKVKKKKEIEERADNEHKDDSGRHLSIEKQIQKYIEVFDTEYGILTDGKVWRLYHKDESLIEDSHFEFRLGNIFHESEDFEIKSDSNPLEEFLKIFYLLFSRESHCLEFKSGQTPLTYLLNSKKSYADNVETDMKKRFIGAMNLFCNAYYTHEKNERGIEFVRSVAESNLFTLFFVKTLEERGRLPFVSPKFKGNSITEFVKKIRNYNPDFEDNSKPNESPNWQSSGSLDHKSMKDELQLQPDGFEIYDGLLKLYKVLEHGGKSDNFGLSIHGFQRSVFTQAEKEFTKNTKINNHQMVRILFQLFYTKPEGKTHHLMIPFKLFSSRQLGSIYESFLEFKLVEATDSNMIFDGESWKKFIHKRRERHNHVSESEYGIKFVEKGQLYFDPNGNTRRLTGSYYTDDRVVEFIVQNTLDDIASDLNYETLAELKICDPAMGSGHFLSEVVRYLTKAKIDAKREVFESHTVGQFNVDIFHEMQEVLKDSICGVDINKSAVKLARMSLWLLTANHGRELPDLDLNIKFGDGLYLHKSFDFNIHAFVGNPPYVNAAILSSTEESRRYKEELRPNYESASGAFDLCALFTESCAEHSPLSRIGFILPNKLLSSNGASGMRTYIFESETLFVEQIDDISRANVFPEASVYPIILIFGPERPETIKVRKHQSEFVQSMDYEERTVESSDFLAEMIADVEFVREGFEILENVVDMCGAATVAEAYEIKEAISNRELSNSSRFIVSGNILPFGVTWGVEKTQYLGTSNLGPFVNRNHRNVPSRRSGQYLMNKIIIPNMTKTLRAYVDNGTYASAKSTTLIYNSSIPLEALAAYINSDFATEQFKARYESLHLNGDALRIGPPELANLPIPMALINDQEAQVELARKYREIETRLSTILINEDKVGGKLRKFFNERKHVEKFQGLSNLLNALNEQVNLLVEQSRNMAA